MIIISKSKEENLKAAMLNTKPTLILIQSTDSPIGIHLEKGIWERQRFSLLQYAKVFNVLYYTCDSRNHQILMPPGVTHKNATLSASWFGGKHILYYLFLLLSSFKWRRLTNVTVRVIGVNVPVVPVLKLISGKKLVISYQFDWAIGMKKDYRGIKPAVSTFVQSAVIKSADHLLCTTQWLADIAYTRYNLEKERTTIIPNYVNCGVFKPESQKKKQVAFAGRLHWSKGVDTLIKAFKQFIVFQPEYQLIIMGSGEEERKLRDLAEGVPGVIFKGSVTNSTVAQILNESEIFVLPTVNMEGHPKALVEAMAAGCKCITSDVPGNNNVLIESDSAELLFPSRNDQELSKRLLYASTMSNNKQLEFALRHYSSEVCFETEISVLKSFINK